MDENSTQLQPTLSRKTKPAHVKGPRRSTIDIIRQFARAYSCDKRLQPSLADFIAN